MHYQCKMARKYFKRRNVENNQRHFRQRKESGNGLDKLLERPLWIHREVVFYSFPLHWNPQELRKGWHPKTMWNSTTVNEASKLGKLWREMKRLAIDRSHWESFPEALCSKGSDRN